MQTRDRVVLTLLVSLGSLVFDINMGGAVPARPLSSQGLDEALNILFKDPNAAKYTYYYLELAQDAEYDQMAAGNIKPFITLQDYVQVPFPQVPRGTITWYGAPNSIPTEGFVRISGYSKAGLPYEVAKQLAVAFQRGFVCRFVVAELFERTKVTSLPSHGDQFFTSTTLVLPDKYADQTNYFNPGHPNCADKPEYETFTSALLVREPLQPAGMLWGWKAASEIIAGGDLKVRRAAWRLILGHYSLRSVATMTAYALDYMDGYSQVIAQRTAGGAVLGQPASDAMTAFTLQPRASENLGAVTFGDVAHALTSRHWNGKQRAIAEDFLAGWLEGSSGAMGSTIGHAYAIGYSDGYLSGFAKGYADGYGVGYDMGYNAAWRKAHDTLDQIRHDAGTAAGRPDGDSGVLETAKTIVGIVEIVAGAAG